MKHLNVRRTLIKCQMSLRSICSAVQRSCLTRLWHSAFFSTQILRISHHSVCIFTCQIVYKSQARTEREKKQVHPDRVWFSVERLQFYHINYNSFPQKINRSICGRNKTVLFHLIFCPFCSEIRPIAFIFFACN